jgi:ubiquitin-conjugating enzyme E2 G1
MNSKKYSTEILKKQLQDLMKSTDLGFSVGLVDDNDFYKWTVCFTGPEDTIYEGGFFKAILTFPDDFPQNPPEMKFITEMWHPNIYKDGRVCISILHSPGVDRFNEQESAEERWRPVLGVEQILVSVVSMLNEPNCDSPANIDASVQFRDHKEEYKKKVRQLVLKSMDDF